VSNRDWWSAATDLESVKRRAGGRRAHNARRRFQRDFRRTRVAELLKRYGPWTAGVRVRIARELGVHKSTITRDAQALLRLCPVCGGIIGPRGC
jgi:hypothetical protein